MSNYGYPYPNGYGMPQQQFPPMAPQAGMPMGGQGWPSQQMPQPEPRQQVGPTSGPLADDMTEDGFQMPRRLAIGSSVPVMRCPSGEWALSFVMNERELHSVVYVQISDGTFAPYHLEGIGALRIAPDAADGQAYLMRIPARSGKPIHVLHVPPEATSPGPHAQT